ncbi:DUF3005 domain-containing protein [Paraburkholderia azotifigens]|uniref:DUF3005 domain-containing protein n=1 Tax=Paraburkholderia azotifigens TaxID=2057004 RepID=A0A5C6VE78_9BURK|nr:DUF3005 domain-containing protein [Paraburkholderia azotifigens]TXC83537.1 DUF3005 domain-containing protein [Paraburkholderia azotifigens]
MSLNTRKVPATQSGTDVARSAEMHNDRTHDSTVDTDSKNHEAARIAGQAPIGPDEITTSNASLVNSVPDDPYAEVAGFDSRIGGNHLLLALEPGYRLIDKGMTAPEVVEQFDDRFHEPRTQAGERLRGRIHYALNHQRPTRLIELERVK